MTVKKWWQRYLALVRWSIWCWRQGRRAAEPSPRRHRPTYAADGAHEVPQGDAGVAAESRVLKDAANHGGLKPCRSRTRLAPADHGNISTGTLPVARRKKSRSYCVVWPRQQAWSRLSSRMGS